MPFRLLYVFGPLQAAGHAHAAVIPQFVSAALEGRPRWRRTWGGFVERRAASSTLREPVALAKWLIRVGDRRAR
jgi:hypothetical protein